MKTDRKWVRQQLWYNIRKYAECTRAGGKISVDRRERERMAKYRERIKEWMDELEYNAY